MTTTFLENLTRLQEALDQLGRALIGGDADAVLRAEEPLASAVTAMGRLRRCDVESADRADVSRAIAALKAAVHRCQSLGRSVQGLNLALVPEAAYGPRGLHLVRAAPVRRLESTS